MYALKHGTIRSKIVDKDRLSLDKLENLHETLWVPMAKKQGANTVSAIRDLELSNEDAKILERMRVVLLANLPQPFQGGQAKVHMLLAFWGPVRVDRLQHVAEVL